MNIKFEEIEIDWPYEIKLIFLRKFIISKLNEYGEPLRWAISSISNHSGGCKQKIIIEVVFLISKEVRNEINHDLK